MEFYFLSHTIFNKKRILPFFISLFIPVHLLLAQGLITQMSKSNVQHSYTNLKDHKIEKITPNDFQGTDIERIQAAINAAHGTTDKVIIPRRNANGTNIWKIDSAILLPGNMTVILDNCVIQLSDKCRDNMFRSNNVGVGIKNPSWIYNISIIGIGQVLLKGADNPRATGDWNKTLLKQNKYGAFSYGSDAGKSNVKQTGDWRNNMILMAYVKGFRLENVTIENSHAWAISCERTQHGFLSDIRINNAKMISVNGKQLITLNKDGIDLLYGCKDFHISGISGTTGDDFLAINCFKGESFEAGTLNSYMLTPRKWTGPIDDVEDIYIKDITAKTHFRGMAIRATDSASIHHIYIDGMVVQKMNNDTNALSAIIIGGIHYGQSISLPGKIHDIYVMNTIWNGGALVEIQVPVYGFYFMNGIYHGNKKELVTYEIDKNRTKQIILKNVMVTPLSM